MHDPLLAKGYTPAMSSGVRFDVWVCQGRLCTSHGSDAVCGAVVEAAAGHDDVSVYRGGCYGLCELGPNVVVRRFEAAAAVDTNADRLTLSHAENETVYCGVAPHDAGAVVSAHVDDDAPLVRLTRAVREKEIVPKTPIEQRMRDLRLKRESQGS